MARTGKIARLPRHIRAELNARLQDGHEGKEIVPWLNSLLEVKRVLAASFEARPINEQNLSDWRLGGYEEWLAQQDVLSQAGDLAANQQELETVSRGGSLADHLAAVIGFRYAAILAGQGLELDEKALLQFRALRPLCQVVVNLRRSDHTAARLKIENQRWEMTRLKKTEDHEEAQKTKYRAQLAAPFRAMLQTDELVERMGGGKAAEALVGLLQEIETCADPATFLREFAAAQSKPKSRRPSQKPRKSRPSKPPPAPAAAQVTTAPPVESNQGPPSSDLSALAKADLSVAPGEGGSLGEGGNLGECLIVSNQP